MDEKKAEEKQTSEETVTEKENKQSVEAEACDCECHDEAEECSCEHEGKGHGHGKKKEIERLKTENESLRKELDVAKNAYYKAYADTENAKRRLQQEFDTANKYKMQNFGKEILPVIDNLERALIVKNDSEDIKTYVKGFEMIYHQLVELLKKEGITEIEASDKPFDPNFHQALMQESREGVESGMVLEVLQKGYMIKDRILRPALVKVSE